MDFRLETNQQEDGALVTCKSWETRDAQVEVNGDRAHPIMKFLKMVDAADGSSQFANWNFNKWVLETFASVGQCQCTYNTDSKWWNTGTW